MNAAHCTRRHPARAHRTPRGVHPATTSSSAAPSAGDSYHVGHQTQDPAVPHPRLNGLIG